MRRPENLNLKYFFEKMTLCNLWEVFTYVLLWRWRSKDSVVLKFERCEHRDDTSIVDGDQERYEVLLVFCVERQSEEVPPCGGMELCGCSSCVWGLRSLLNTEGILTLLSTIEVSSLCSHLSNFKTTEYLDLHLQRNTIVFTYHKVSSSPKKYLNFTFSGLFINSSTKAEEGTS